MPITKSAKKQLRVSKRKRVVNLRRSRAMDSAVRAVKKLVLEKNAEGARTALSLLSAAVDKAARRGVIKSNTAARTKSRLSALVKRSA